MATTHGDPAPSPPIVRDATVADMAEVSALVNALVDTTTVAWTEEHEPVERRVEWWHAQQAAGDPVLVAEVDGHVVGVASYGDFRDSTKWPGYRFTAEHSVHVREDHWGTGVGRALMEELVRRARAAGLHALVGAVDGSNGSSIRFHERLGFVVVGRLPQVGRKFDRWLDLVLVELVLDPADGR